MNTVCYQNGSFRLEMNPTMLIALDKRKFTKLVNMFMRCPSDDGFDIIAYLDDWFPAYIKGLEKAKFDAAQTYTVEYKDCTSRFAPRYSEKMKKSIQQNNKRLMANAKKAASTYEKAKKRLALYEEVRGV